MNWISIKKQNPANGQKCLVVFESTQDGDPQRWMDIDAFNDGMFDFIANWEDQCMSVALPAGSTVSKVRAVCWYPTELNRDPLAFDEFWDEVA